MKINELVEELERENAMLRESPNVFIMAMVEGIESENARLREAAQHCRLFIADRKGYHTSESEERKSIIAELDDILSNRRDHR
jgi:hypothetical protein